MAEIVREDTGTERVFLSVEEVGQSFGSVDVLEEVAFGLDTGSVTALVGPNGAGKTTLLRIVAGLADPDSGRVVIRTGAERPVGYLPQAPRFRPVFTVEETLEFYASHLSTDTSPEAAMDRTGLLEVRDRRVAALSGGMRRLLGLAQALLGSPPLLILDEPTSGLDPRMTRHLFEVTETVADDGTTVLLSTHDLTYAAAADRLVVLNEGRTVFRGTPEEGLAQTETDSLSEAFVSMVGPEPTVQVGIQPSEGTGDQRSDRGEDTE
jgi:ABC-type multidrug transport system ATPase subunit